jgi:putative sporulation protein YtaF
VSWISSLVFAVTLSIDSFFAGSTYGMKNIKISWKSQLILTAAASLALMLSMTFGGIVEKILNPVVAKYFGALILSVIGLWSLISAFKDQNLKNGKKNIIASFKIRPIGVVVKILREPALADADESGAIDPKEAVLLGAALALDSLGAGFGAAAAGFDIYLTTLFVALMSAFMLSIGIHIGRKFPGFKSNKIKYVPGSLLITLALIKALF